MVERLLHTQEVAGSIPAPPSVLLHSVVERFGNNNNSLHEENKVTDSHYYQAKARDLLATASIITAEINTSAVIIYWSAAPSPSNPIPL